EDGLLTSEEIANLDLSSCRLAVLSACRTGLGEIHRSEGVLGLRRAFQAAGAKTLLCSLWPVDDPATRDWMRSFYTAWLAGSSVDEATRTAMRSALAERRARGASTHPFFWGAFIALGDWR